jgi:hypothetical protein
LYLFSTPFCPIGRDKLSAIFGSKGVQRFINKIDDGTLNLDGFAGLVEKKDFKKSGKLRDLEC